MHMAACLVAVLASIPQDEPEAPAIAKAPPALLVDSRLSSSGDWCRGWPLVLRARLPKPAADAPELKLRVLLKDAPVDWPWRPIAETGKPATAWALSAEQTAALAEGTFRIELRRGDDVLGAVTLRLVPRPETPGPEALKQGFHARLAHAVATGDADARKAAADEYAEKLSKDPDAHTARGDALAAAGKDADALKSFEQAIVLWGDAVDPPEHLVRRCNDVMRRLVAKAPTRPAKPFTAQELEFFAALDAAEDAMAKGEFADAVRGFERALRVHRNNKLTLDAAAVEARLEEARKAAREKREREKKKEDK
jgi:tetratricopeptide (TPR) repeat protein